MCMFGRWGKMYEICKYAFENLKVYKQKMSQITLFHTTNTAKCVHTARFSKYV